MSAIVLVRRGIFTIAMLAVSMAAFGQPAARQDAGFPVVIQNCGLSTTYTEPPKRAVAMNQAATEIMLTLGLQDRMAGTAYLDDAVLPNLAAVYATVPVLATKYPSLRVLLGAHPDFVYAAYMSAFDQDAAGTRDRLAARNTRSYVSPSGCGTSERLARVSMTTVYGELRDIGRIFGVSSRAETLIAGYRAEIRATQEKVGRISKPARVFWYDSGDPPSTGACCGVPNEIMRLAGAENVFSDASGSWATVNWEEVVARNPDMVVLVDASWSMAADKRKLLSTNRAYASVEAVKRQRFVTIDFSSSTSGIRIAAAVRRLAESLYPQSFK